MEEISSKCCKFFKCGKLVFKFLKIFALYNIERENPFEGRFLVCKVSKRVIVFSSEWEVWKKFLQSVVSFSSVEKLVFESIKFQGESVWKRVLQIVENFNFQV